NEIARSRGQSMAQMALAWDLRQKQVTSVLIGASRVQQVLDGVAALNKLEFTRDELNRIDSILG
ncbi:MAG: aldo/keto reductase, partial [Omnitrophica WOR_2 bacterium]